MSADLHATCKPPVRLGTAFVVRSIVVQMIAMSDHCHVLTAKFSTATSSLTVDSKLMRLGEGIVDKRLWCCLLIVLRRVTQAPRCFASSVLDGLLMAFPGIQ